MAENTGNTHDSYPQISLSDLEDMAIDANTGSLMRYDLKDKEASAVDNFHVAGTYLESETWKSYLAMINNLASIYSGHGPFNNTFQNFLSRIDIFGTSMVPLNVMNTGFTFITRPRMNLTSGNLKQFPIMNTLNTTDPLSVNFMIRALLDTQLCSGQPLFHGVGPNKAWELDQECRLFAEYTNQCGLLDTTNPFLIPACNALTGISGFPDLSLQEETTEGDFHSGDYTFSKGSDMNNRTQELSLEFRDVPGSVILSIFYYWILGIALQNKGIMNAYPDDIYEQRLNYTCSIYRFVVDNSKRQILWWAKATGCFPKSVPIGALFNVSEGETSVNSAMKFTIPFVANDVKVNEPGALLDFNILMNRYTNNEIGKKNGSYKSIDEITASLNFSALPYITTNTAQGIRLDWRTLEYYQDVWPEYHRNEVAGNLTELEKKLKESKQSAMESAEAFTYAWQDDDISDPVETDPSVVKQKINDMINEQSIVEKRKGTLNW